MSKPLPAKPKSKPKPEVKDKRGMSDAKVGTINAFFAKYNKQANPNTSNSSATSRKPKVVEVEESDDELLLKSPPKIKRKEKEKNMEKTKPYASLEDMQTSSPPSSRSLINKKKVSRARAPDWGGPGPSTLKKSVVKKTPHGVFGGTVNKFQSRPHDSSAISRESSVTSTSTSLSKHRTKPNPKVNSNQPSDTSKTNGLEAVKDSMRKPKVVVTPAQLQWERDYGPMPVTPVLSEKEKKKREEDELTKAKAMEFIKSHQRTVEIVIPPPVVSHTDDEPGSLSQLVEDQEEDEFAEAALTVEEKEYLQMFCDPSDLCLICGEPLPSEYHQSLHDRETELKKQIRSRGKDYLAWELKSDFCNAHKLITQTIPLGRRAGYPETIPWLDLWRKLEIPWIRSRIETMVKRPTTSPMFRYYFSEDHDEEPEWARFYARAQASDHIGAGYYGDLGVEVIKAYLYELEDWGYLPFFERMSRYKPLGPKEFVTKVLIPEISIMLIQHDQGYQPEGDTILEEESYTKAQETRKKSMIYGKLAYYEMDSDVPSDVILDWHSVAVLKARKEELDTMRGRVGLSKERVKAAIVDLTEEEKVVNIDLSVSSTAGRAHQTDMDEPENCDSDIEVRESSQNSHKSSSSRSKSSQTSQRTIGAPRSFVHIESSTPEPPRSQKRESSQISDLTSSDSQSPPNIRQISQPDSAASTPRKRCRKRKREEIKSKSVSMSQESFGDFDFPSQDVDRLDAIVAAQ